MGSYQERIGDMRRSALVLLALFLFIVVPFSAMAKVSVSLRLGRSEATMADSIKMVISISGTRSSDSKPILHGLENFNVTQGGTSSRLEIINGKINTGIDYTYFIQPKKAGNFKIGPAEVTISGKTFTSNSETLTVVKPRKSSGVDRGPVFLNATLSSQTLYVEEQAIYSLKLYWRVKVREISLDLPETEHLTLKQLGKPTEYQSVYDGQSYQVLEVRYALIPSKKGKYMIGPSRMNMTVFQPRGRSRRRSLFDDPFFSFSRGRPMTLASEHLELDVLPLPGEGRPGDFTGLVGTFEIESKLEPSTIKAGESATLTITLSGRGNVNRIPDLKIPDLEDTKLYADQPVLNVEPDAKGLAGSKTMKWALVPEKEGHYQIPQISVSFFDSTSHQYRVIKTFPQTLSVLPGKKMRAQSPEEGGKELESKGTVKQPVKVLARDILPIHTSIKAFMSASPTRPKGLFSPLLLFMPIFAYTVTLLGTKFRKKSIKASAAMKARKASRVLIKKCRRGNLSARDSTLSIRDYLNDRFGLSLGSLTPDEASEILQSKGVSLDTAQELRTFLQRAEDAIYTGKGHESGDMGESIPRLVKTIEKESR